MAPDGLAMSDARLADQLDVLVARRLACRGARCGHRPDLVVRAALGMPGDRVVRVAWAVLAVQAGPVAWAVSEVRAVLVALGALADPRNGLRRPTAVHLVI